MSDSDRISALEKRIKRLEEIVEMLSRECGDKLNEENAVHEPLLRYDFTDGDCLNENDIRICNSEVLEDDNGLSFKSVYIERVVGFFCDPMLINTNLRMPIKDVKFVHVRLKANVDASKKCMLRVYFTTEKYGDWSQSKSVCCVYPAGRVFDVYVETKNKYWTGNITGLRIDPVEGLKGRVELELVELNGMDGNPLYSFDFTKINSIEETDWRLRNTSGISCAGKLFFDIDVMEKKRVYTDPFICFESLNFDTARAKYLHVKMRTDLKNCSPSDDIYMQVLFKTKSSDFWSQDRSMRFSYQAGKEIDAYIEIKQLLWKGTLTAFRIDPFENYEGQTTIKLVELLSFLPENTDVNMLESRTRNLDDRFNKIYK